MGWGVCGRGVDAGWGGIGIGRHILSVGLLVLRCLYFFWFLGFTYLRLAVCRGFAILLRVVHLSARARPRNL